MLLLKQELLAHVIRGLETIFIINLVTAVSNLLHRKEYGSAQPHHARRSAANPELGEIKQLVIRYAAPMTLDVKGSDAVFDALRRHFGATQIVELTGAIAT